MTIKNSFFIFTILCLIGISPQSKAVTDISFCTQTCPDGSSCEAQGDAVSCTCENYEGDPMEHYGPAKCTASFPISKYGELLDNLLKNIERTSVKPVEEKK